MLHLASYWKNYVRSWKHHFSIQFATFVVLSGTFFLLSTFLIVSMNLNQFLVEWGDSIQMSVFLKDNTTGEMKGKIKTTIQGFSEVSDIHEISKTEAKNQFSQQLGAYAPELLSDKDFAEAFPASFQISFLSRSVIPKLKEISQSISSLAGVENVSYGQEWVDKYSSFLKKIKTAGWALSAFLVLGILFILGNAIRASISSRAEEVEVLELIGASPTMIRTPFLFEGFVTNAAAATVSLVFAFALLGVQKKFITGDFAFFGLAGQIEFLSPSVTLTFVLAAGLLGVLGSSLCLAQINDGWSSKRRANS